MSTAFLTTALVALIGSAPAPLPPSPDGLPRFDRVRLENGLEVVFFEARSSPWLEMHLVMRAGSLSDPANHAGLAALTAGLMTAGTADLNESALSDRLALLGASLGAEAERHHFTVSGSLPTFDAAAVADFLDIFADVALRPTFPAEIVARDRQLRQANVARLKGRHGVLADTALRHAVFGSASDSRPNFGYGRDLPNIDRSDIVAWHRRVTSPSHAVLLVGGSFEKKPMLDWISNHFGSAAWPPAGRCEPGDFPGHCARLCDADGCLENPSARALPAAAPASTRPSRLLVLLDDDNLTQIQWRMGFATPFNALASDYGALRMGYHLLGGDFTARLNQVLRAREGLTYGAYATADFGAHRPDIAVIRTDAPPDTLSRAIELTRNIVAAMRTEPVPEAELAENRSALGNGFAFRFESIPDTLSQLRFVLGFSLEPAWLASWVATVTTPSAATIRDAFARHVPADGGHLVVVGPASLLPALKGLEPDATWATIRADHLLEDGLARLAPAP